MLNETKGRQLNNYYYGLDLVRFFCAVLVAIFHLTWRVEEIETFAWFGWVGVQIFFVISGLVIANSANNTNTLRFLRSRFLRLYPGAMVCALISFSVILQAKGLDFFSDGVSNFLRSFFLFLKGPYIASAYWTLPIELSFYFFIFVILLFGKFNRIRWVLAGLCSLSSLYIAFYSASVFGLFELSYLEFGYGVKNITLMRHGIFFSIGIYLWLLVNNKLQTLDKSCLAISLVAACFEISARSAEILGKIDSSNISSIQGVLVPATIFYLSCFFMYISARPGSGLLQVPEQIRYVVRLAGLTTYPLYLLHENVGNRVKYILIYNTDFTALMSSVCGVIMSVVVSIGVAVVAEPFLRKFFSRLFEMEILRDFSLRYFQKISRYGGKI